MWERMQACPDSCFTMIRKIRLEAKFCIEFCLALLLRYRKWGLGLHTQEMVENPEIRSLYPKVKVHIDEELSKRLPPEFADLTSIVTVKLKDVHDICARGRIARTSHMTKSWRNSGIRQAWLSAKNRRKRLKKFIRNHGRAG